MRICSIFPLEDKIIFSSFDGQSCGDNPRALYEEIRMRYPDIKCIWLLYNPETHIEGAEVVKAYSVKGLYHQATARLWFFCSRQREWIYKRKDQFYVQTWHGDVCLKKIEADAKDQLGEAYMREAKHDSEMTDLMLSGSTFRTNNYRNAFLYTGEILELGTPKFVIYYEPPVKHIENVRNFYKISEATKIALYCPTFRSSGDINVYNLDYEKVLLKLKERWPGQWVILVRLHPNLQDHQGLIKYTDTILNGSAYFSIEELIIASDLVITDYSGCMFQGLSIGKKVILYTPDLDIYMSNERDFYFDIRSMPFPLAESNEDMEKIISDFNEKEYAENTKVLKESLGYKTTVESTQKIIDYIFSKVKGFNKYKVNEN